MKYSYNWLQRHIEQPLPPAKDLIEKIIFHAFEVESFDKLRTGDIEDYILDIKVLPDRAADCLSHAGMAREIAGLLNLTFVPAPVMELPSTRLAMPLSIESALCDRYCAIRIDGVRVGPSPDWLKDALESIGQKSINNIVDATNLVLFDSGQPTHAFDAAKIVGGITIREARPHETIVTLSDEQKALSESNLVIADDEGLLAIAGVKGGKKAEVTDSTTAIVLEIAHFDPVSVRKTARKLNLLTDAAKRFENNLSVATVDLAAQQLVGVILKVAGGEVSGIQDYYPKPFTEKTISFSLQDITRLLGTAITTDIVQGVLNRYHYIYSMKDDRYDLTVPYWRPDLTTPCNVAEEVGRVYGYEHIPAKPLPFVPLAEDNETDRTVQHIKQYLASKGYSEVMNYTFRKKGDIAIAYGPKDKSALRTNLADALKESYEMNRLNAPLLGLSEVKLFEVGTVFNHENESLHVATADKTEIHEWSVVDFYTEHQNEITKGTLPVLTATMTQAFKAWSAFPFIVRDIAVWVGNDSQKELLQKMIEDFASAHCVRPAVMFDTFSKNDKTSIAYRLVFQAATKTLTDEEVQTTLQPLLDSIISQGMEIR